MNTNNTNLRDEMKDYLFFENIEILQNISTIENKFKTFWENNSPDDEMIEESEEWGNELKELYGKLSVILKMMKEFNLDEGRNKEMFKESKIGGDCFYSVTNYEVRIRNRKL